MYFKYMNLWYVTYVKLLKKKKKTTRMQTKKLFEEKWKLNSAHPPTKFPAFKLCENLVLQ